MNSEKAYIRQLKRELSLPSRKKKDVLRDVKELFDDAREHGETADDVIERLGAAADLAKNLSAPHRTGIGTFIGAILLLLTAIFCFGAFFFSHLPFYPSNAIGHKDAVTSITVTSGFDPLWLLLFCGTVCLIAAMILGIRFIRSKKI